MKDKQILICGNISGFPDDRRGSCACGNPIVFRPHMAHIAHKVCFPCGIKMVKQDQDARIGVTKKAMQEIVEAYYARRN